MLKDLIQKSSLYHRLKTGPCRKCIVKSMCTSSNRCEKSISYLKLYNLMENPNIFIINILMIIGLSIFTGPLIPGFLYIFLFIIIPISSISQLKESVKDNGFWTTIIIIIIMPLGMIHIILYLIFLYTYIIIKRY